MSVTIFVMLLVVFTAAMIRGHEYYDKNGVGANLIFDYGQSNLSACHV